MAEQDLTALNIEIGLREAEGDRAYFDSLLTEAFAMRRAGGAVVSREAFLSAVKVSDQRPTVINTVRVLGPCRAVVECTVTTGGVAYANVRLFVRADTGQPWQLLAWANEPAG
jgi:hypothetical protein